jgi:hypothetical protein
MEMTVKSLFALTVSQGTSNLKDFVSLAQLEVDA